MLVRVSIDPIYFLHRPTVSCCLIQSLKRVQSLLEKMGRRTNRSNGGVDSAEEFESQGPGKNI